MAIFSPLNNKNELAGTSIQTNYHSDGSAELEINLPERLSTWGGAVCLKVDEQTCLTQPVLPGTARALRINVPDFQNLLRAGRNPSQVRLVFESGGATIGKPFDLPQPLSPTFLPPVVSLLAGNTSPENNPLPDLLTADLTASFSIHNPNPFPLTVSVFRRIRGFVSGILRGDEESEFEVVDEDLEISSGGVEVIRDFAGFSTVDYFIVSPDQTFQTVTKIGSFRPKIYEARLNANDPTSLDRVAKPLFIQDYSGTTILFRGLSKNVASIQVFRNNRKIGESRNESDEIRFFDSNAVIPGRRYSYKFVVLGRRGERKEFESSFVRYGQSFDQDLVLNVKEGTRTDGTKNFVVEFDITERGVDRFTEQLPQEFVQAFTQDLDDLRSFITQLLFFEVHRYDLNTSEGIELGIVSAGQKDEVVQFVDKEFEPTHDYLYLFTPIVITPVTALERSAQAGEVDDIQAKIERFRRFFSPLAKNWFALPSRARVSPNAEGVVEFLLAPGREEQTSKVASQKFVISRGKSVDATKVLNVSQRIGQTRIGANFPDVVVSYKLNRVPVNGARITLRGIKDNLTTSVSKNFFLRTESGELLFPEVGFAVTDVSIRLL
jgi:hypothetical protein